MIIKADWMNFYLEINSQENDLITKKIADWFKEVEKSICNQVEYSNWIFAKKYQKPSYCFNNFYQI